MRPSPRPIPARWNGIRWLQWAPWMSLGAFTALWVARWPAFPLVLDPYYHLLIAQQVADAGGPIAHEWWEYAPVGRPHLYPPLLHLGLAGLLNIGASPLFAIRFVTAGLLPGLLLSVYLVVRRLFTPSLALTCLWIAMVPFSFHLHSAVTLAATLAMIELLWLLDALGHGRWRAAALLLGLLGYTHLGMPWIGVLTLCVYGGLRPAIRGDLLKVGLGLVLALPWWWHLLSHRAVFHQVSRYENQFLEVVPLLLLAALIGMYVCWRSKQRFLLLVACWFGFGGLAWGYTFRWVSGEGLLPIILLAGVGVHWLSQRLARTTPGSRRHVFANLMIVGLIGCSPTLARQEVGWQVLWADSSPFHLFGSSWARQKELDASFAVRHTERLAQVVATNSEPREILWSNAPYVLGLIAALARRPTSSAMFSEVRMDERFDPVASAHMLVWFKYDPLPGEMPRERLLRLPLRKIFEDDVAVVYRREEPLPVAAQPRAVVPWWLAAGLTVAMVGFVVWELTEVGRSGHRALTSV